MIITRALIFSLLWLTVLWQPMWQSLAIAIIFDLIFATLLTLGVVPVLYSLFYRVDFRATGPAPAFQ